MSRTKGIKKGSTIVLPSLAGWAIDSCLCVSHPALGNRPTFF